MEKRIKIAEVIGKAKTGGVISCVYNFFSCLNKDKFQVDFYTYGETMHAKEINEKGGRVFKFPSVFRFIKCIFNLRKKFKKEKYDIVHVHMTTLSFVPLCAAWLAGVKVRICHSHSMGNRKEGFRFIVKECLRPLSKVFSTHLAGCSELANRWLYGKKKGEKAFLLHNAVYTERFVYDAEYAQKMRGSLNIKQGKVVGTIGRLEKQKNVMFTIDFFAELCKNDSTTTLVVVGAGSLLGKIEKKIKRLNIFDRVILMKKAKNVGKIYSLFDVFVLPSLFEGLPLVLVESQINGLPCLVSDKITKEIAVTPLIEFLPIKDKNAWAEELSSMLKKERRFNLIDWRDSGYDVKKETKKLEDFYINGVFEC